MPQYIYQKGEEEVYVEVIQSMNEEHRFFDSDGLEWRRVFTVPHAVVSSGNEIDPFNIRKCVEKTGDMKGSVGDLWDFSGEMSERRAEKLGHEDPVKRKYFDDYQKKNDCKHFHDAPRKIETEHATIDLSNPLKELSGGAFDLSVSEE